MILRPSRRIFLGLAGTALAAQQKVRITDVRVTPVRLAKRLGNPQNPFAQLAGALMVEIETDQGFTGYGLGGGGSASAHIIDRHLRGLVIGQNPLEPERLYDRLYSATLLYGRRGLVVMALSGIDLALWDIAGKAAGKPVYELIGGKRKDQVPAYYTNNNVAAGLALGLKAFKIPVRETRAQLPALRDRLAAVRKQIGPDAKLMIDCICTWDVETTLEAARLLEPVRLDFIEEPISPDDIEGYERLCREVKSTRIAHGEHEYTAHGFRELVRHNAAHILQPDLTWCGGLTEGLRIARMARERNIPVLPHRGGSAFAMALILSQDNCPMAESFGIELDDNELMQALKAPFEKGYYRPWTKPGFGLNVSAEMIREHALQAAPVRAAAPTPLRFAICNETFGDTPFAEGCRIAREAGFQGIEIAPFTLGADPAAVSSAGRAALRAAMRDTGMTFAGLHALLNAPPGLHLNSGDAAVNERSWAYLRKLIDLCADLGDGGVMVLGSGKQRSAVPPVTAEQARRRLEDGLATLARTAELRGVTILLEPLGPGFTNVVNTLDEAVEIVRRIGSPAIATMLDVRHSQFDREPAVELFRRHQAWIRHVHVNEMDGRHPGTGHYEFGPVLRALAEVHYRGWVSVEVFDFKAGGEAIAAESMRTLRRSL